METLSRLDSWVPAGLTAQTQGVGEAFRSLWEEGGESGWPSHPLPLRLPQAQPPGLAPTLPPGRCVLRDSCGPQGCPVNPAALARTSLCPCRELLPSGTSGGLHQAGQSTLWLVTFFSRCPDTAAGVSPPWRAPAPARLQGHPQLPRLGGSPWAQHTPQSKTTERTLSPHRPLLGTASSFPPISKSCGLRRVVAQPPPCTRCLFPGLAKNAGKLGGGDTGNASFPLRTAPAASGGSWGRGAGRRKVVPPPRQTRTPQPCTQKGSFSPILAHCECPLRGESAPYTRGLAHRQASSGRGEVFFL